MTFPVCFWFTAVMSLSNQCCRPQLQREDWITVHSRMNVTALMSSCLDPALNSLCNKVFRSARSTEPHLATSRALETNSEIMDTHSYQEDIPVRSILDMQSFSPTVTLHGVVISEIYLQVWVSLQSLPDWPTHSPNPGTDFPSLWLADCGPVLASHWSMMTCQE